MTDVEHISRKGTGVPISWFPIPDESELPDDLQGLFRKAREMVGFVPNVFRAYSYRPERLSAWFAHYRQLHEPTPNLDAAEREMIAVAVSMANGCLYCLVAHGAALARGSWRPHPRRPHHPGSQEGRPRRATHGHPGLRRQGHRAPAGLRP